MGGLLSRGRGSTVQVLEHLDQDISVKQEYEEHTQLQFKYFVGRLVFLLVVLYVLSVLVLYFYWYPSNTAEALHRLLPLICFPAIIWLLKQTLTIWFSWKLSRNHRQLENLKKQKEEILNKVKEKETYKHAMEILERFDSETKVEKEKEKQAAEKRDKSPIHDSGFRRRPVNLEQSKPDESLSPVASGNGGPLPMRPNSMPIAPKLARPILPRERTTVDKVVDYLLGDGPNNRFALVCSQCRSHNGMALQEEFQYIAFRCCYCFAFNPARKLRPNRGSAVESPRNLGNDGNIPWDMGGSVGDKRDDDSSVVPDLTEEVQNSQTNTIEESGDSNLKKLN